MTYECEAREAIGDFKDVRELLGDIASRARPGQKERGMRFFTSAYSINGLLKSQIVSTGSEPFSRRNVRAFHVGIREAVDLPWKRYTLNLGAQLTGPDGELGYQIRFPDEFDRPRLSLIAPTLEAIPPALEEVFVRGIGQFCLNSD